MEHHSDEELDDFDFKSMLSSIDPLLQNNQSFYLSTNNNSSGFFPKPTASPQPVWTSTAPQQPMPHRLSRSNSGHVISSRLRCASDMHQLGYLNHEEKSYMKDLILSRNERFKEELAQAERTSDWQKLSQYLRHAKLMDSNNNNNTSVVDSLVSEFDTINNKKRMASNSFGRPKKSVVPLTPPSPAPAAAVKEEDTSGLDEQATKQKKNERERKRRLAVSNGFDELFVLLKLPQSSKIDKVSILRKAIDRIQELEDIVRSNGMVVPPPNHYSSAAAHARNEEEEDDD